MNIINDRQLKNLVVPKKTFIKDASIKNLYIEARITANKEIDKNFYFRYKQNKIEIFKRFLKMKLKIQAMNLRAFLQNK